MGIAGDAILSDLVLQSSHTHTPLNKNKNQTRLLAGRKKSRLQTSKCAGLIARSFIWFTSRLHSATRRSKEPRRLLTCNPCKPCPHIPFCSVCRSTSLHNPALSQHTYHSITSSCAAVQLTMILRSAEPVAEPAAAPVAEHAGPLPTVGTNVA